MSKTEKIENLERQIAALEKSVAISPTPEDIHDLKIKRAHLECAKCMLTPPTHSCRGCKAKETLARKWN